MSASPLRPGDIVRIRDERWSVSRHTIHAGAAIVDVQGCDHTNRGVRARFVLPFESYERLPMAPTPRVVRPRRWRHMARAALACALPSYDALRAAGPAGIAILPYQLEPALAVSRGLASRLLIADDVGLGKTIQAGLIVAETLDRVDEPHALVVAPASLREQWAAELQSRFALSPAILDAAAVARESPAVSRGGNPWAAHPLIVTSIDYVKRPEVLRSLETLVWDVLVFDEAHALTGRSDRRAAAAALAERARTVLMLSATPHSGDDGAFARLCGIGDLNGGFPLAVFRRTRRDVGLSSARRTTWLRVSPTTAEVAMHAALMTYARRVWTQRGKRGAAARLAMMVLTRRACSSAGSLARSVERRLALLDDEGSTMRQLGLPLGDRDPDDDEPSAALIAPGLDDQREERRLLERILRLAQLAMDAESKLGAVRRLLRRTAESAIVFTEYRDTLTRLAAALKGVATAQLHGGLSPSERNDVVRQFTAGTARVLLATDAASEGLNLHQRCRLVINLELPWTPLRLEQRIGRVERIGQQKRVHAVHVLAAGTSEEGTVAQLMRRMERVQRALAGLSEAAVEGQIASAVFGEAPAAIPDTATGDSLPPGLKKIDLRTAAMAEATRMHSGRLLTDSVTTPAGAGPFLTAFVSRRHPRRGYWAFRLEFTDGNGQAFWDAIVALTATVERPPGRDRLRDWADASLLHLAPCVDRERLAIRDRLVADMRESLALAARREHAIIAAVTTRHARIATALLQPALFDRRAERVAAAQREALNDTLAHCATRLRLLEARERIRPGSSGLVFAVIAG